MDRLQHVWPSKPAAVYMQQTDHLHFKMGSFHRKAFRSQFLQWKDKDINESTTMDRRNSTISVRLLIVEGFERLIDNFAGQKHISILTIISRWSVELYLFLIGVQFVFLFLSWTFFIISCVALVFVWGFEWIGSDPLQSIWPSKAWALDLCTSASLARTTYMGRPASNTTPKHAAAKHKVSCLLPPHHCQVREATTGTPGFCAAHAPDNPTWPHVASHWCLLRTSGQDCWFYSTRSIMPLHH